MGDDVANDVAPPPALRGNSNTATPVLEPAMLAVEAVSSHKDQQSVHIRGPDGLRLCPQACYGRRSTASASVDGVAVATIGVA